MDIIYVYNIEWVVVAFVMIGTFIISVGLLLDLCTSPVSAPNELLTRLEHLEATNRSLQERIKEIATKEEPLQALYVRNDVTAL